MTHFKFLTFFLFLLSSLSFGVTAKLKGFSDQGPYVDTLRYVSLKVKDWDFFKDGDKREINVLKNRDEELIYKLWLQDKPAPLIVIIPGLGGSYAGIAPTALAEIFFNKGSSVLIMSDPFSWQFLLSASSRITPGYTPVDARDTYNALYLIMNELKKEYGARFFPKKILLGYSLGALNTLFIADIDSKEKKINFDRFVALSPPVNLLYGLNQLDEFYNIWRTWPVSKIEQTKNKAVSLFLKPSETGTNILPVTSDEAKFAIGYTFRNVLEETIKAIHSEKDFGILKIPSDSVSWQKLEKEIERFSYKDYVNTFLRASYSDMFGKNFSIMKLGKKASLPAIQNTLLTNPKIRIIHTADDFLLTDYDRKWLKSIMGDRMLFLNHGGHLGYFNNPDAQKYIVKAIKGARFKKGTSAKKTKVDTNIIIAEKQLIDDFNKTVKNNR
jgi:predicted alpha/beta-fold hydrolase